MGGEATTDATSFVSVPCAQCQKPVHAGDDFCSACGAEVAPELKRALTARLEASDSRAAERGKLVRGASTTILVLSVLFVIGGVVFYFIVADQAETALRRIAELDDNAVLNEPIAGATTVAELRAAIEREPYQVLGLNLFLAAVMLGLFFWSKRALLPAVISALGIYVTVQVASALVNPATLAQGIIMKVIVIVALVKGIKAAMEARAMGVVH